MRASTIKSQYCRHSVTIGASYHIITWTAHAVPQQSDFTAIILPLEHLYLHNVIHTAPPPQDQQRHCPEIRLTCLNHIFGSCCISRSKHRWCINGNKTMLHAHFSNIYNLKRTQCIHLIPNERRATQSLKWVHYYTYANHLCTAMCNLQMAQSRKKKK